MPPILGPTRTTGENPAAPLTGAEYIRGVQGGLNVRMTAAQVAALGYASPGSADGDMIVHSGGGDQRLPVGANGLQLVVDTTQPLKVKWYDAVGAFVARLATTAGATLIGFVAAGAGALTRTLQAKVADVFSALDYAQGDGSTDDTAQLNALIANVPANAVIYGFGRTYCVTSLALKSNLTLRDFNLISKAGTTDMVSAINVDGTSATKSNITLENVIVNGNRANQTNINDAGAENGGRHGFRFIGSCQHIRLYNCQATFCAGDGFEFYSDSAVANLFQDIVLMDCVATNNRRHGSSLDSAYGVSYVRCNFNNNGLDLNTSDALSVGTRGSRTGATLAGNLYGNGLDMEGYGNYSTCQDVYLIACKMLGNARNGLLMFPDGTNYSGSDFIPWQNIHVIGGHYDEGIDPSSDGYSLEMTPPAGTASTEIHFRECELVGVGMHTPPLLRNGLNVEISGDVRFPAGGNVVTIVNSNSIDVDLLSDRDNNAVSATNSTYTRKIRSRPTTITLPSITFGSGAAGSLANQVYTEVDYDGRGYVTWEVTFDYVATATATAIFSLNLPSGVTLIDLSANSSISGSPNLAAANLQLSTPRLFIAQTSGSTSNNALFVKARLSGT